MAKNNWLESKAGETKEENGIRAQTGREAEVRRGGKTTKNLTWARNASQSCSAFARTQDQAKT